MGVTYLADVFHFEVTVVQIQFDHSGKDDNNNLHRTAYESKKKLLNLWNVDDSNVLHHLCKKKPVNFSDFNYPLSASQRRRVRSSSGELLERRAKWGKVAEVEGGHRVSSTEIHLGWRTGWRARSSFGSSAKPSNNRVPSKYFYAST